MFSPAQRDFLAGVHFAVVATVGADGMPQQTVMWYLLDGDDLLLNTPHGSQKHHNLQRDARLSVCVEEGFRYVTVRGRVELDDDPQRGQQVYRQLGERYQAMLTERPALPPDPKVAALLQRPRVTLRLKVEHVYSSG